MQGFVLRLVLATTANTKCNASLDEQWQQFLDTPFSNYANCYLSLYELYSDAVRIDTYTDLSAKDSGASLY